MSYQKGQRVVCIDDDFDEFTRQAFQALPVKGQTYTVRAVYLGRSDIAPTKPGASDGEVGLLLEEIRNQDHEARFNKYGMEPGFSSRRFAPLVESEAEAEEANAAHRSLAHTLASAGYGGHTRRGAGRNGGPIPRRLATITATAPESPQQPQPQPHA